MKRCWFLVSNITSITDSVNASRGQTYGDDDLHHLTSAAGLYGTFGDSNDNRLASLTQMG